LTATALFETNRNNTPSSMPAAIIHALIPCSTQIGMTTIWCAGLEISQHPLALPLLNCLDIEFGQTESSLFRWHHISDAAKRRSGQPYCWFQEPREWGPFITRWASILYSSFGPSPHFSVRSRGIMSRILVGTLIALALVSISAGLYKTHAASQQETRPNPNNSRVNVTCTNCTGDFASYAPDVATSLKRINEIEESQCFKDFFVKQYQAKKIVELQKTSDHPGFRVCRDPYPATSTLSADEVYKDITQMKIDVRMEVEHRGFLKTNCGLEGLPGSDKFTVRDSPACWRRYAIQGRASLIAHEVTHKLGYRHCIDDTNSPDNVSNMPYLVQNAIEGCWDKPMSPRDSAPIPANPTR
jgi:hypothetical protein